MSSLKCLGAVVASLLAIICVSLGCSSLTSTAALAAPESSIVNRSLVPALGVTNHL
jgi:hypothetical protein